ncbi:hypothetical protein GTS_34140 [Gandjariella thermophila]|uniref:Uncharacterized protein n=2 Tax=Gandjariella thermophila TaxID=1931992 RepID=A0A4D4J5G6_9PSEU|nr:hypothetical protein GTS_34140 [Gandjariella thermophila]
MPRMSYRGYNDTDPRLHPGYGRESRREQGGETLARVINVVVGLVTTVFVLHVVFVVAGANKHNGFVSLVHQVAKALVLGFGDVFTPDDAKIGVVLNYGLAAIIYAVVGQLIVRALRRR